MQKYLKTWFFFLIFNDLYAVVVLVDESEQGKVKNICAAFRILSVSIWSYIVRVALFTSAATDWTWFATFCEYY